MRDGSWGRRGAGPRSRRRPLGGREEAAADDGGRTGGGGQHRGGGTLEFLQLTWWGQTCFWLNEHLWE